jgi:hypothetical protein
MACDKEFFVILALIIPRKKPVEMHNIDVYMAPLIEELQVLWRGVATYDVARAKTQRTFHLKNNFNVDDP